MEDPKQQLVDKLKSANNILVTVSRDPSVDQLAALLGLTLLLNKAGKHAAAVFSGKVPSTLEFLRPEDTIEKDTNSLRDFIIALDKAKADKLRYKVEDNVVKIFITPYKTSITQDDFDFSQGDFNVDVVVAIGVRQQEDLDDAITAHGRILHDATVTSINITPDGGLGTINWHDPQASSLSELATELAQAIDSELLDEQIATALLTGVVAETDRFRNEKTSSRTMTLSAALMAAGANQQLVATKLEEPQTVLEDPDTTDTKGAEDESAPKEHDGVLDIDHQDDASKDEEELDLPPPDDKAGEPLPDLPDIDVSDLIDTPQPPADALPEDPGALPGSKLVTEPPTLGGTLTANSSQPGLDPVTDPLSLPSREEDRLLERKPEPSPMTPPPANWTPPAPPAAVPQPAASPVSGPTPTDLPGPTLTDIEASVAGEQPEPGSPALDAEAARDEVSRALNGAIDPTKAPAEPVQALNAQPFGGSLHADASSPPADGLLPPPQIPQPAPSLEEQIPGLSPTLEFHKKQEGAAASDSSTNDTGAASDDAQKPDDDPPAGPQVIDPNAPPPVPPPIPFQFGNPPKQQ